MGLGSKDNNARKELRKTGGSDWKAEIKNAQDAYDFIAAVRVNMAKDPNGVYLTAAYMDRKIAMLEKYIREAPYPSMTFKEFERGQKN